MCSQDIRHKINELGMEEITPNSFYKEVDYIFGFNYCYFLFSNEDFFIYKSWQKIIKY